MQYMNCKKPNLKKFNYSTDELAELPVKSPCFFISHTINNQPHLKI